MRRFDPLVLAVAIPVAASLALLSIRIGWYGRWAMIFLGFNLFLALLPFVVSTAMSVAPRWAAALLAPAWLAFLPNAPYLVSDLIHLRDRAPVPLWFDAVMFCTFAATGVLIGAASLMQVVRLADQHVGRVAAAALVPSAAVLVGVGVYIGRYLRWNSWDLVTSPMAVVYDFAGRASSHQVHTGGFVAVYAGLLLAAWMSMAAVGQHGRSAASNGRAG